MSLVDRAAEFERFLSSKAVLPWLNRAAVVAKCPSTQDVALRICGGRPGLMVAAIHQTGGRGRLGRKWIHRPGFGLAATFVLDEDQHNATDLPIRAGCAVCAACEKAAGIEQVFKIKWPNDVVAPSSAGSDRKLAGVLIEKRDGLLLMGIGVNVLQQDWPPELGAVSLAHVAHRDFTLETVAEQLIAALDRWLLTDLDAVRAEFSARDSLSQSTCTLEHDGRRYTGKIEAIEPWGRITIRTSDGEIHVLPAASCALVKD